MNSLREVAHQLDPARWVRDVLGVEPAPWQEKLSACAAGGIHSGIDSAPEWQNHRCGVGDGAYGSFHA